MKKLISAYILSFVGCFMLFLYEPIMMYANNINDFWFDFGIMFKPMICVFFLFFVVLSLFYTLLYFIDKKCFKKFPFFYFALIISFIVFFASYIQGNYLIGNLPRLDGSIMDWSIYGRDNVITLIIWIVIILSYVITIKKFNFESVVSVSRYVCLAVFGMLFVSLFSVLFNKDIYKDKMIYRVTYDNYNVASTNKNLFIFLLDTIDQKSFDKQIKNGQYKSLFDDFTFYPDSLAGYPCTRDSIPLIFSGVWNNNEMEFSEYCNVSMDDSKFIKKLESSGYSINMYEDDMCWKSKNTKVVENVSEIEEDRLSMVFFGKQEIKFVLFKYLPYYFKKYSRVEGMNFRVNLNDYFWSDLNNYNRIKSDDIEKQDRKIFSFLHIEGGHVPFDIDENFNYVENGTYEQKLDASIKIIDEYISRLKKNGVYDNSAIVILADHGYNSGSVEWKQNPILYIKGVNEHHKMYISDKQISYVDLSDAFIDLIDGKKSNELFSNISDRRIRKFNWYQFSEEDHMVEYSLDGYAWETEKLLPTGRVFDR